MTSKGSDVPEEASADMRHVARKTRDLFVAMVHEGFSVSEALTIVGQILTASIQKNDRDD